LTLDNDEDGIMDSCDPDDNTPMADPNFTDTDADGFQNSGDNCPLLANSTPPDSQRDSEIGAAAGAYGAPGDKGPRTDGMGDACEPAAIFSITQNGRTVCWGGGAAPPCQNGTQPALSASIANGRYHTVSHVVPRCFGGIDADGDGYCTGADFADSGFCAPSCAVRHTLWVGGTLPMLQQDTDGDTVVPVPPGQTSIWSDVGETYLGTDPTKPCAETGVVTLEGANANDEFPKGAPAPGTLSNDGFDAWPLDNDDNQVVNVGDFLRQTLAAAASNGGFRAIDALGGTVTIPFMGTIPNQRFDLNYDGFLNAADPGKYTQYMNKRCGDPGAPPLTLGTTFQY
jgi:hypothetical protein